MTVEVDPKLTCIFTNIAYLERCCGSSLAFSFESLFQGISKAKFHLARIGCWQRALLLRNHRQRLGANSILIYPVFLVLRHVNNVINCFDRTGWYTSAAVDANIRIYVEPQCVHMKTLNRAMRYTVSEAARKAIFSHDMGHES